mmetsp:Transcript_4801/g.11195  ORF Transcript_4801/g.11195 Transcript_4801/m.11195 type:complete len:300 (-) Transcript_4801:94-993(-)
MVHIPIGARRLNCASLWGNSPTAAEHRAAGIRRGRRSLLGRSWSSIKFNEHSHTTGLHEKILGDASGDSQLHLPYVNHKASETDVPFLNLDDIEHQVCEVHFWQEMFSAVTMLPPSILALWWVLTLSPETQFPQCIWALAIASWVHCPASMIYHITNGLNAGNKKYDPYASPLRLVDVSAIHCCAVAFAWAVSHGDWLFTQIAAMMNLICVARLTRDFLKGKRGAQDDLYRVCRCIAFYLLPLLWRGDFVNFAGAVVSISLGGVFQLVDERLHGWGHGLFHLMLTPYVGFLLHSAAANF